jgi:dolichyl-diphosphooligosaccharide--protein glycosyltransferase
MFVAWGDTLFTYLFQPLSAVGIQSTTQYPSSYPNVFISVGELQIPSPSAVVTDVGGIFPLLFGVCGWLMIFWGLRTKKANKKTKKSAKTKKVKKGRKSRRRKEEPEEELKEKKRIMMVS